MEHTKQPHQDRFALVAMPPSLAAVAIFLAAILLSFPRATAARPAPAPAPSGHDVPAVFAFGDSTLDPGNNNRLTTLVRADHAPYGRDFPGGEATGRFTDGKLITDYIVSSLGIKDLLPAYHSGNLTVADASTGASFASGGSGLDDMTARNALVSTFGSQLDDFRELLGKIGAPKSDEIAKKSLYVISAGTNDVTMYYLLPLRSADYPTVEQYGDYLIGLLQSNLKSLYQMGARKMMVAGLPPLGCLPVQKSLRGSSDGCIAAENEAAERYNAALQKALAKVEADSPGAKIAYVDIYTPLKDMAENPKKYGFTQASLGCCGTGMVEMGALCTSALQQCQSPSEYVFFDSVHPTQATYKALADAVVKSHVPQLMR
ncbi:GDSL esterase/lipase At2g40250-like [Oryza brachyantha]|uniref:GDSL esterase/lipase At2g40250-like n=1 Tax=Oryza brachyantha TaxID=4533 RepID=UPI001ADA3A85|nr:GDSL esterase/lipase At2g40250-like [Oryza brachyantha]